MRRRGKKKARVVAGDELRPEAMTISSDGGMEDVELGCDKTKCARDDPTSP